MKSSYHTMRNQAKRQSLTGAENSTNVSAVGKEMRVRKVFMRGTAAEGEHNRTVAGLRRGDFNSFKQLVRQVSAQESTQ